MIFKLIEELDTDTDIDWWNSNRERVNTVIRVFNDWQTIHRFDQWEGKVVIAKAEACERYGEQYDFSRWQYEILGEIKEFVRNNIDDSE
ncbi:hypothetical protein HUB98_06160 [Paenibacillus barcinonensis]|uniref:Uncharacterized protein n=1 Tax=Paenibacillus barcinonensis TaxID=198119 RepID=A0A2V4VVV6_PAEBA|nr:hypothetical protein [Paenibacillus barcinonensis]PYE51597.1 hypothetical protein DFQ00_102392 [Paenibacillus barcinonensis]QKS55964.1 hypothetical protein HUB98_06160 [Paenibacillus barcinonensis]